MLRWRTGHLWIKSKVHKRRNSKTNNWIGISCTSTHYFLITYSVLQNVVQQFKRIYFDTLFICVLTFKFKRFFFIVDKLFITIIDIGPKVYVQMYRNYQNKHAFWKNCTINIFPLPPNFIFTVLYTCIARGRFKFLNLCPIPDVILYNKNMFKSIQLSFCVQYRSGKNSFLRRSKGCIKNQCRLQLRFYLIPLCVSILVNQRTGVELSQP